MKTMDKGMYFLCLFVTVAFLGCFGQEPAEDSTGGERSPVEESYADDPRVEGFDDTTACVDELYAQLVPNWASTSEPLMTDPAVVNDVLENDMFLHDYGPVRTLLLDARTEAQPLGPMLQRIRAGLVARHAPVAEGLCGVLEDELIPFDFKVEERDKVIDRAVTHMYLLNEIVREMNRDWRFHRDIREHMLEKRSLVVDDDNLMREMFEIYRLTGGLFEPIKTKTIDWVMGHLIDMREAGEVTDEDSNSRRRGVILNVMEVVIADKLKGFDDNALTGISLAINPTHLEMSDCGNRAIEYVVSNKWMQVYQGWMLTFLMGNVPNLHLLYPKMLIPEVIDVGEEDYLFNRVLALGLTIDFVLLGKAAQKDDIEMLDEDGERIGPAIARRLASVNVEYAREMVEEQNGHELTGILDLLRNPLKEFRLDSLRALITHMGVKVSEVTAYWKDILGRVMTRDFWRDIFRVKIEPMFESWDTWRGGGEEEA